MDASLRFYHERMIRQEHVLSVLLVAQRENSSLAVCDAELLYVIILNRPEPRWETRHLVLDNRKIVEHRVSQWQVEQWAVNGTDERMVSWICSAQILYDTRGYIGRIRDRLARYTEQTQKRRVCEEYSHLLGHYLDAKDFWQNRLELDAYHSVLKALDHWARLVACEAGEPPDPALWTQVKRLEPSVYKLYEELIASHEPLEKRIELLLLPIELHVMSRMKKCVLFLQEILQSKNRPWSFEELRRHPEIEEADINLGLLLDRMVKKSLVREVIIRQDGDVLEKGYFPAG
ncbi:nucleotidyltransferase-like protein [Brevibacillus massiliensis]|jgi:hypothetical protein|uniref:nucleotidyltransferase-like protein n=1 Tax=Brevibacillus massiliensis TaxID=1118054 RepID=UPI0002D46C2E|nr:nucleotidyltransferase-like protein [Brevibacillus massiliensis]